MVTMVESVESQFLLMKSPFLSQKIAPFSMLVEPDFLIYVDYLCGSYTGYFVG